LATVPADVMADRRRHDANPLAMRDIIDTDKIKRIRQGIDHLAEIDMHLSVLVNIGGSKTHFAILNLAVSKRYYEKAEKIVNFCIFSPNSSPGFTTSESAPGNT